MSARESNDRFGLGVLESDERYVGCLHFRQDVGFVEAVRLWHEVAAFAAVHYNGQLEVDDAEVCREYEFGAAQRIYDHPVTSAVEAARDARGVL